MQATTRLNLPPLRNDSEKLSQLSDEELCQKAQQGCAASRGLLWHRHRDFVKRVVYKKNRQLGLPEREMADALQSIYFAFHEALQQYDPEHHSNGKSAAFKTFLGIVIAWSFSNHCRQWQRYRKHVALNPDGKDPGSFAIDAESNGQLSFPPANGNDGSLVDWKEMILHEFSSDDLATALTRLKPKEIHLLQIWLQCGRDKEVAEALGISTAAAKLRRERLLRRIKQRLSDK